MNVEKVVLYRSVDGVLHESEQVCLARNFALETRPKIKALIEQNGPQTGSGVMVEAMDVEEICEFILKFTPELVALLQPLVTPIDAPCRTRRSKAEVTLEKAAKSVLENKAKTQTTEKVVAPAPRLDEGDTDEIGAFSSTALAAA